MKYDPHKHHRRSVRLEEYDYSQPGGYFATICTHGRECLLGEIRDVKMNVNELGSIVQECWNDLPKNYVNIELDQFIVMPNHMHGIVVIIDDGRGLINQTPTDKWILMKNHKTTLGKIVRSFKAKTTKMIHDYGNPEFQWQRNYYEHIIRGEKDLNAIREYIYNNPLQWSLDEENPDHIQNLVKK